LPTSAWISSTMTTSTVRSAARAALVSIRYSDSGVVISTSASPRAMARRSRALVSPLRTATVTGAAARPLASAAARMPASGAIRLRSTSTASALIGDT
jgi:hypothetical protein